MGNDQLIKETLSTLKDFLPNISSSCLLIAELLRQGNEGEAMQHINAFAAAVDWSVQAINGIKSLEHPLNIETVKINKHLVEVQEGLIANDIIMIADMFEYELHPEIEEWLKEINTAAH